LALELDAFSPPVPPAFSPPAPVDSVPVQPPNEITIKQANAVPTTPNIVTSEAMKNLLFMNGSITARAAAVRNCSTFQGKICT
jgi:hypothetical protein